MELTTGTNVATMPPQVVTDRLDVAEVRETLKLTRAALARQLGVHPRTIKRWELSGKVPHDAYRERLRQLLREAYGRE